MLITKKIPIHSFYDFVSLVYRTITQIFCFHHFLGVPNNKILEVKVSEKKAAKEINIRPEFSIGNR